MKQKDDLSQMSVIGSPSTITHFMEVEERRLIKGVSLVKDCLFDQRIS